MDLFPGGYACKLCHCCQGNGIIDDVYGADFANDDGDPFDDQMHGTHCAGTIAGRIEGSNLRIRPWWLYVGDQLCPTQLHWEENLDYD